MFDWLILFIKSPIWPSSDFIHGLFPFDGGAYFFRCMTSPPCALKSQNDNIYPFQRFRFGLDLKQFLADMISYALYAGTGAENFQGEISLSF